MRFIKRRDPSKAVVLDTIAPVKPGFNLKPGFEHEMYKNIY